MGIKKEYKKYFGRQIKDECVHNAEDVIEFAKYYKALSQHDVSGQSELLCPFCGSDERVELNTYCKWLCSNCDNAYGHNNH